MKKLTFLIVLLPILFLACSNGSGGSSGGDDSETPQNNNQTNQTTNNQTYTPFLPDQIPEGYDPLDKNIWDRRDRASTGIVGTDEEVQIALGGRTIYVSEFGLYERFEGTTGLAGKYRKTNGNNVIELWFYEDGRLITVTYSTETPNDKHYGYRYYSLNNGFEWVWFSRNARLNDDYFEENCLYYIMYLKASPHYLGYY